MRSIEDVRLMGGRRGEPGMHQRKQQGAAMILDDLEMTVTFAVADPDLDIGPLPSPRYIYRRRRSRTIVRTPEVMAEADEQDTVEMPALPGDGREIGDTHGKGSGRREWEQEYVLGVGHTNLRLHESCAGGWPYQSPFAPRGLRRREIAKILCWGLAIPISVCTHLLRVGVRVSAQAIEAIDVRDGAAATEPAPAAGTAAGGVLRAIGAGPHATGEGQGLGGGGPPGGTLNGLRDGVGRRDDGRRVPQGRS